MTTTAAAVRAIPPISAVMTVRDGERYIGEAIDSMLAQSAPTTEIVIVDDGSQDGTAAIVEGYGGVVRLLRQEPLGQGAALNAGIEIVSGELIAFLDADDLWTRRKNELQAAALAEDPALDMAFGQVEEFVSPELAEGERAQLRPIDGAVPAKLKGTMLIRAEAMNRAGPFATDWVVAEFVDWCARAHEAGLREAMVDEVVLRRRLHRENIGRRRKDARQEYARVMGDRLRRRRAAGEL
jgi:glycosyltransferase involved in cell wall biosynthesis